MARAMGSHARETLGTPFHPDMRCISALLRVRLSRLVSKRLRPYVWAGLLGLASTRIMLLAHYASDVVAGLVLGAGLGKAVRKITE
jgi:membrane-associated phospholipid phosphatase